MLAYAAKYAGAFYGPFREAVESTLQGDRRQYQQDPPNIREALREVDLDVAEGADIVMVKPALPYLDVIAAVRDRVDHPGRGLPGLRRVRDGRGGRRERLDRPRAVILETLTSIKRGAQITRPTGRPRPPSCSRPLLGSAGCEVGTSWATASPGPLPSWPPRTAMNEVLAWRNGTASRCSAVPAIAGV